jgi:hypothetical protein
MAPYQVKGGAATGAHNLLDNDSAASATANPLNEPVCFLFMIQLMFE